LNNRVVVPYNLYLVLKYKYYINVEVCSIVNTIKYIYKYIYKGMDRTIVEIIELDKFK
ncbi:uncharacterized protein B0T23DRAFT_316431, partial [Neurospora hispaniola]